MNKKVSDHSVGTKSVSISPDGKRLFLAGAGFGNINAGIWDVRTGMKLENFDRAFNQNWSTSFSKDKRILAVTGPGNNRPGVFCLMTG